METKKNKTPIIFGIIVIILSAMVIGASDFGYEQNYKITINPTTYNKSNEIIIETEGLNGILTNPIEFDITVNYTNWKNLNCLLSVEDFLLEEIELISGNSVQNLSNGNYSWTLTCTDETENKTNSTSGQFTINENEFKIIDLDSIYLAEEEIRFEVNTPDNSEFFPEITNPLNSKFTPVKEGNEIILGGSQTNKKGNYNIQIINKYFEEDISIEDSFYIAKATIIPTNRNPKVNEEVEIVVNFESDKPINYIFVDYKDSKNNQTYNNAYSQFYTKSIAFKHTYEEEGIYKPTLKFQIEGREFEIESKSIEVGGNEAPEITLISPKDKSIIQDETIIFKYKVNDDGKINECEYLLMKKEGENGWYEEDWSNTTKNPSLNKEIVEKLTNFEDGEYTWYVTCKDNFGKETEENYDLTVKTTKHEYEDEIKEAQDNLDAFLEKIEDYKLEEKNALDELGISEKLNYYKKALPQIDQDLGKNIKFISNENLKEEMKEEKINKLKEIAKNIPQEIEIIDSSEFIKNSLTDLEKITEEYAESKKIDLKQNQLRRLAEQNKEIQEQIGVTTKTKTIEITYNDRTEKTTIVKKEINIRDDTYTTILEKIPEEIKEIEFKTKSQEINKNLFEIDVKDIENDEIIYFIKEDVKTDEIKETNTIIFEEFPVTGFSITGYAIFDSSEQTNSKYYILFIILLAIVLYFGKDLLIKFKLKNWKKEEDVRRVLEYSTKAKRALQNNNQENAKEDYHKIKEIFGLTPKGFRDYIYPTIKKIRIGIDKRDMQDFIKEYEEAKKQNRKEDTKRIYQNIQNQYKKLPQKYQEKVYERVIQKRNEGFSF
jgi:hypothetical protein